MLSSVHVAFSAHNRPLNFAPVTQVIEAFAITSPINSVPVPKVADDPTIQVTFAFSVATTAEFEAVVRVLPITLCSLNQMTVFAN